MALQKNNGAPRLYIIAGPNGSGKTTFAKKFLPLYAKCNYFVNADLIAQGVSPFSPETAVIKAGKIFLEEIHLLASKSLSFAFETTLSGRTYFSFLDKLKQSGYSIHLFFLWLPSVELALKRIETRVALGGHSVPEKDVKRRFQRSIKNLFQLYQPLLDSWMLFDNSSSFPRLIAREVNGSLEIIDRGVFHSVLAQVKQENGHI